MKTELQQNVKNKIIRYDDFIKNEEYFKTEIPKAQNSDEKHINSIFNYYKETLSDKRNFMAICEYDNHIIGCITYIYYEEEKKYFLINVNTQKDFQHKGIAKNLIKFGNDKFFDSHNTPLYLWVNPKNIIAKNLYEALNFKKIDNYYPTLKFLQNEKEDIYCLKNYKKQLSNNI